MNTNFKSIIGLLKSFPNEQSCINHLEELRWNGKVVSSFDSESIVYSCAGNKYKCKNTGKYFNVKTNTLFDNTKIKLQNWFLAIYIVTSHKKGISSLQLAKDIDVTQKTAWFMIQRIRNCFGDSSEMLSGKVEVDETYVGGDINKMNTAKKKEMNQKGFKSGYQHKTPVLGMIERKGNIKTMKINKSYGKKIKPILYNNIHKDTAVITDGFGAYKDIDKVFKGHVKIEHAKGIYALNSFHTNTIGGFWSLFKRGMIGIYYFTSKKHLQMYIDEFTFRYNSRDICTSRRFNLMLNNIEHRLTYNNLING
ncbi:MAG TPA: IS1595 family transposase [Bacteroidales bacterium]|nr:IS1595 family transposase [Bacteroidales bacterium]